MERTAGVSRKTGKRMEAVIATTDFITQSRPIRRNGFIYSNRKNPILPSLLIKINASQSFYIQRKSV